MQIKISNAWLTGALLMDRWISMLLCLPPLTCHAFANKIKASQKRLCPPHFLPLCFFNIITMLTRTRLSINFRKNYLHYPLFFPLLFWKCAWNRALLAAPSCRTISKKATAIYHGKCLLALTGTLPAWSTCAFKLQQIKRLSRPCWRDPWSSISTFWPWGTSSFFHSIFTTDC